MITREKWINAKIDKDIGNISNDLISNYFSDDRGFGFNIVSTTNNNIKCKFIEKITVIESFEDPFGKLEHVSTIRYVNVSFEIIHNHKNEFFIIIFEPPRSVRNLISHMSQILGSLSIKDFDINLIDFYENLKINEKSRNLKISKLKASNIPLTNNSYAKVDISSTSNALEDFSHLYDNISNCIDKIKFDNIFDILDESLEISRRFLICYDDNVKEKLRIFLLNYLRS